MSIAVVVAVGLKVLRSFRELGTDAERATHHTLHAASQAGAAIPRRGLNPAGAARKPAGSCGPCSAARPWPSRDTNGSYAWDGPRTTPTDLMELASSVLAFGQGSGAPAGPEANGRCAGRGYLPGTGRQPRGRR